MVETTTTAGLLEPVLPVQKTGPESGKQDDDFPAVEVIQAVDQMAGVVKAVLLVQETGLETGKQQENVPGVEVIHAPVLHVPVHETDLESGKQEKNGATVDVIHADDHTAGVTEPVLPAHETGWESGNQDNVPAVEIIHVEDQSTIKPVGNNR